MKKNIALFTLLCVSTLAFLPGCLGKKKVVKTEKVNTAKKSKELIED
ncbi:MAG: hypothetical protein ACJAZS_000114 [Alteromonas naphthalenivorans]|jgi:hypothetical protein